MSKSTTIGGYLIQRFEQTGLKHIFGIPGDYVLSLYDLLEKSSLKIIGTCTEIGAPGYVQPMPMPVSTAWEPCALPIAWEGLTF